MMLWIVAAALAVMTMAFVLAPVLRRRDATGVERADGALAIFADQIREVDREAARGLISEAEAEAAKIEIKRRMLAASRMREGRAVTRGGKGILVVLALLAPVGAGALYWQLGSPEMPSMPFALRADERAQDREIVQLTETLRKRLLEDANGGETEGWILLGQTYMRMQRFGDAALAFARVVERPEATSGLLTQYAEALIASEEGIVTNRAAIVLERAAMMDPDNPAATFYQAQWLDQEGRMEEARDALIARVSRADGIEPWMDVFVAQINRLGGRLGQAPLALGDLITPPRGPSQADMDAAAEMSGEDRMAFIRSMVEGLAAKLQENPADLDGWLRLGRAYSVLGETARALEAYRAAEPLLAALPEDDPRRAVVAQGIAASGG